MPLTENPAIHIWIAEAFPGAGLLPDDAWRKALAVSILSWCASGIHPHLSRLHFPARYCDAPGSEDGVRESAVRFVDESLAIADTLLEGREFLFEAFTAADAHLFWCIRRASQLSIDIAKFASCHAFYTRMLKRPSVEKVLSFEKETLAQFGS